MKRLVGAFVVAALCGAALAAQETRSTTLLTTEHYLNWERVNDAQISPDGSRIVYTRQAVNQLEDKWESALWILNADGVAASLPRQGLGGALVARRQASAVSRRGRAEGAAALRALGGCRRPGHADHPCRRGAAQRAVVARRQVGRLLHVHRGPGEVDDQHAARAEGREVDAGAPRGRHDPLPAGSGRLPRRRVHAPLRRAGRGRHAASADDRQVERRRRRAPRRRGRSTGRPTASRSCSTATARPTPTCSTRPRSSSSSTSRPARFAISWRSPGRGAARSSRPTAGWSRSPATRRPGRSHTVSDLVRDSARGRRERRHAEDQRRLRSRSDQPALGAGRHRRVLRRRRSRRAQRAVRVDRRRREAGHDRQAHPDVRFGLEGSRRRGHRPPIRSIRRTSSATTCASRARSPSSPTSTATCCRASSSRRSKRSPTPRPATRRCRAGS